MLSVSFDTKQLNNIFTNVSAYSKGFLDGIGMERITFNRVLGGFTAEALANFIDARARMEPESLHHVYEPSMVGRQSARLFDFNVNATTNTISITGKFLPSRGTPKNGGTPFTNKAEIMENGIAISISPRGTGVLAFEDEGEQVFTTETVVIEHPGGDSVAGAFGRTVSDFFDKYFTVTILKPLLDDLASPEEFSRNFSQGAKSGRSIGVRAGRQYFKIKAGIE